MLQPQSLKDNLYNVGRLSTHITSWFGFMAVPGDCQTTHMKCDGQTDKSVIGFILC